MRANFHHIHLNVVDKNESIAFYKKFFGAKPIKYRGCSDALFTEKSFFLLDEVATPPLSHLETSLWHIGWSGVDGASEFNWRVKEGIEVHSPISPLGEHHWMYFYGPNKELLEVYTGNKNHTFEHIHLFSSDVDKTMNWFKTFLALPPVNKTAIPWGNGLFKWNHLLVDNINIYVIGKPEQERDWWPKEFKNTEGTAFDHIGFSFTDIEPILDKMVSSGVELIKPITVDLIHGLKSFFVRGTDGLLIEIVEEKPIPEGIWS